ncbi:MAG: hypothetical protein HF974_08725 [ANME-2 cluster archaeon]|nr:hypothetical protein [ANME-2 cluster archaeon]
MVLFLLWGSSALPDVSNVSTNKSAYNPGETVHITINHTSNITASVIDPYGSQNPLVLTPSDLGYLAEYSPQQGVILGTYTVQVFGEGFSDSSMFKIRSLSIHPDINETYPLGNVSLPGEVVDAESGNGVNASLDVTINDEMINSYAKAGDFFLNYSAITTGYKTLTITAVDDENITGTITTGFEVHFHPAENLSITTSQVLYEAGQNVDIRVVSGQVTPIVWVMDPLGIFTSVKVSGKCGIYSGMYSLDKHIILGEYWAEAETENPADHVKAAFNVTAPVELLTALQDAGVEFSRLLSGPRTVQHKVPPLADIQVTVTATVLSPVINTSLVEYYPDGWTIKDSNGGTVDTENNTITWDAGDVENNVSRTYTIFSPRRTMPSTKYFFNTELVYDAGSDMSKDWMVVVSDPDTEQPVITNILSNPDPQVINTLVNITANIIDNIGVSTVYINITLPNSTSTGNLSMTKNGGDLWYYNYTPPIAGLYNVTIYANDTSDNWNSYTGNFTGDGPPVINSISDIPDPVENGNNITIRANVIDDFTVSSVWVDIEGTNYSLVKITDLYLLSAIHRGVNRPQVFTKDETYYPANLKDSNRRFYLNFSNKLVNGSVLRIYAKKNQGRIIGIYDLSDTSGSNPIGTFTVVSKGGEWHNITLANISTPTDAIWLGEGMGSGTDPKDNFDYIYATENTWEYDYNTSDLKPGIYYYTVYATDSAGSNAAPTTANFTVRDTAKPVIENISVTPDPQAANNPVNITANVTDNLDVNTTYINIILPNSTSTGNLSMTKNGGNLWYYNYTPPIAGLYNVTIYANDTSDNWNSSTSNFMVEFLRVNFSFYSDSSYTTQTRDFNINDIIYIRTYVTYSNYTNLSGALDSINVTVPNHTIYVVSMVESSPGIYRCNFSTTQAGSDYQFYALATTPNGITGIDTDTLTLPIYTSFAPGTLVIPMGSQQDVGAAGGNYPSQVSAYGLVHWLLANDTWVDWVILHDKAYDGFDFNATTDDDASNTTGTIANRNYSSGPFLIRDPDTSTFFNEAYNTIQQIRSDTGRYNDVVVHELNQTLYIETRDDYILDRPARIAVRQTDNTFIDYIWDTTLFPASPTAGMNMNALTLAQIRSGDLLTNASVNCSKRKVYDWVFLDDDDFWDTAFFPVGDDLFSQLDLFVNKTGHVHLQGKGVTMNTRTSWLTTTTATYEEDDYPNKQQYSVLNSSADHPLGQTYGTLVFENPLPFDAFEHDNNWRTNTLALAGVSESGINDGFGVMWDQGVNNGAYMDCISGASEDNYAFVVSNSYGGVTSALVGKKQMTIPEMRLALDSVLFSVVTPQFDHSLNYPDIRNGGTSNLTVTGTVDSGMLVYDLRIYDELPTYVSLNNSSVTLNAPGSYTYHTSNNTLEFNLGSPNKSAIHNGTLFSYEIAITPPPDLPTDLMILDSTVVYDDNWNKVITSSHCITVQTINYMSFSASKCITPGFADNYSITLNLTSLVNFNQTNVNIYDLVPANFSIVNPVPDYNGSQTNRYYWTMNMTAGESRTIAYNLVGTGLYRISDVFTVGVDPV